MNFRHTWYREFFENLSRKSILIWSQAKNVEGILYKNLITFILLAVILNTLLHFHSNIQQFDTADSDMGIKNKKKTQCCLFTAHFNIFILCSDMKYNNARRMHCCVYMSTAVTLMRQNVTLDIHCLFCFIIPPGVENETENFDLCSNLQVKIQYPVHKARRYICRQKAKLSRYRPEQAHGRSGRLSHRIFLTFDIRRW
jgi:hypothetical protein